MRQGSASRAAVLFAATLVLLLFTTDLSAARRGIRIDLGSWSEEFPIIDALDPEDECYGAAPRISFDPSIFWGEVAWNGYLFATSAFLIELNRLYCQYSKPYQPGLDTSEYLNSQQFQEEEPGLAQKIGSNTNNAVTGSRYSFLGNYPEYAPFGRQWAFYYFPGEFTIVALYGAEQLPTYEYIWSYWEGYYPFNATLEPFEGQYFCFQGQDFIGFWNGAPAPGAGPVSPDYGCGPTPDLILLDSFE